VISKELKLIMYDSERTRIPTPIEREIKVEAGHNCSISNCPEHTYLEIHHINENRDDNRKENLILLCDKHHKMAHRGVITRQELKKYKELLTSSTSSHSFIRGTESDRVRNFLDVMNKVFSEVGSETGYRFEEEFYSELLTFFSNINIYQIDWRSHDQSAQSRQDRIVDLMRQILDIRTNSAYHYSGGYSARYIPSAEPGTTEYDHQIDHQRKIVADRLYEIQGLCHELWDYVEQR
ncbi:HNH endonuclease signature motif containing protein, partial [Vibrio parahaemolyticus]|nr:HNH endonuclease signature motif containing protein [Vibrio parahaemolyticus]MDF4554870.1 HNH endonuclease signature motif containing protein [Vibrio parahaemolyticus]